MQRRELSRILLASAVAAPLSGVNSLLPRTDAEKAAGVTPVDLTCRPGAYRRYGADPRGNTDSTDAINDALRCNAIVFDDFPGESLYKVSGTLRFRAGGQILSGQGMGNTSSRARTTIRYEGKAGGKVISLSDTSTNWSECSVRDLMVDGHHLANIGIEGYDDAVTGGNWRIRIQNVAVVNITAGALPTAIRLGTRTDEAPGFSNDPIIDGCLICKCARGLWGTGSLMQVSNTTLAECSDAAALGGVASAWTFDNCVFSSNARDFDGINIQQASFSGCWFENSAEGIYRAAGAHSCSFTGCYLHTFSMSRLMDFGAAAGYHSLTGNYLPSATRSQSIVNVNATATGGVFGQGITLTYATSGAAVPLLLPPVQTGTGAVRSATATLSAGQSLTLALGRGTFFIGANVWRCSLPNARTQSTYSAFLFDGDNEAVMLFASHSGSGGSEPFSLLPSNNSVTLTYAGRDTVTAYLSGTGVTG
jgi:Pectate lyase superfamily protein